MSNGLCPCKYCSEKICKWCGYPLHELTAKEVCQEYIDTLESQLADAKETIKQLRFSTMTTDERVEIYIRQRDSLLKERDDARAMLEKMASEFSLLKSYFDDSVEVVLHKNDIKWEALAIYDEFKKGHSL